MNAPQGGDGFKSVEIIYNTFSMAATKKILLKSS